MATAFLILIFSLVSCIASNASTDPKTKVFRYLDEFVARCDQEGFSCSDEPTKIWVDFTIAEDEDTLGRCVIATFLGLTVRKSILIRKDFYTLSDDAIKILVYHEAAHCYLNADHSPSNELKLMRSELLTDKEIRLKGGTKVIIDEFFEDMRNKKIKLWQ